MSLHRVDLSLELLSPCFLGGAYQEPEFRIASLRGVWRCWYRALYGRGDERAPGAEEQALFGGIAAGGGKGGVAAAARLIVVEGGEPLRVDGPWENPRIAPGQVDGGGYLFFSMGMNKRQYLVPRQTVSLRLILDDRRLRRRPGGDGSGVDPARAIDRARTSLASACAFSGLGARSRRMAGAVFLRARDPEPAAPFRSKPAENPEDLARYLRELITPSATRTLPSGSRLSDYHVVAAGTFRAGVLKKAYRSGEEAVGEIGRQYAQFRAEQRNDTDIARAAASGTPPPAGTIRRAAFGLPIGFRLGGPPVQVLPGSGTGRGASRDTGARRGSPFFLTLERLADDRLAVVWCFFRSRLTEDERINVAGKTLPAPDLSLIDEMLRRPEWDSHVVAG